MVDSNIKSFLVLLLTFSFLLPQKTYEFTEEEVNFLYTSVQKLENADSLNQKIIKNLNEQIYMYIHQTEIDSQMIENYKEQLRLKEDYIKELKPKWHENKYLWFSMGILSTLVPIWAVGQIK